MIILNIGAGKISPIPYQDGEIINDSDILVNLDKNYFNGTTPDKIEEIHNSYHYSLNSLSGTKSCTNFYGDIHYCNCDIYNFLENYKYIFDKIIMYRFLEHVPKAKLLYFLYILSTCIKEDGLVDIIVPNYKLLAERILNEDPINDPNFEADDIITTFELLNEQYDPHTSVWTKDRAIHFFELEGRFKIVDVIESFKFDGRDIYLRFLARRTDG